MVTIQLQNTLFTSNWVTYIVHTQFTSSLIGQLINNP